MNIYLAGPMRGIYEFNFPAFFKAAEHLRQLGHEVFSPADNDANNYGDAIWRHRQGDLKEIEHLGFDLRRTFFQDLEYITLHADAVVLLPGWENSEGAKIERSVALFLKLLVYQIEAFYE
jgi:Domain of unknown function (DUF4406)